MKGGGVYFLPACLCGGFIVLFLCVSARGKCECVCGLWLPGKEAAILSVPPDGPAAVLVVPPQPELGDLQVLQRLPEELHDPVHLRGLAAGLDPELEDRGLGGGEEEAEPREGLVLRQLLAREGERQSHPHALHHGHGHEQDVGAGGNEAADVDAALEEVEADRIGHVDHVDQPEALPEL